MSGLFSAQERVHPLPRERAGVRGNRPLHGVTRMSSTCRKADAAGIYGFAPFTISSLRLCRRSLTGCFSPIGSEPGAASPAARCARTRTATPDQPVIRLISFALRPSISCKVITRVLRVGLRVRVRNLQPSRREALMESPLSIFRMDHEPTPNPSQEGNWQDADECLLLSWEGPWVVRFMESREAYHAVYWDDEPTRPRALPRSQAAQSRTR